VHAGDMHVYMRVHAGGCIYVHMSVCVQVICRYMYIDICAYVCVDTGVYMYIPVASGCLLPHACAKTSTLAAAVG
jgi:hypothetical protein